MRTTLAVQEVFSRVRRDTSAEATSVKSLGTQGSYVLKQPPIFWGKSPGDELEFGVGVKVSYPPPPAPCRLESVKILNTK